MDPRLTTRVNGDVATLTQLLDPATIKRHYLVPIERGEEGAAAELFAVARAATHATSLQPHARSRNGRNCDARLRIGASDLALEVKQQSDQFPFNGRSFEVIPGITMFEASRPGADHRVLDMVAPDTTHSLPASNTWRETLLEAAAQLPLELPGIVAVSVDSFGDFATDVEDALYGDLIFEGRMHPRGYGSLRTLARLPNGVFAQKEFDHVAAVWFFRLAPCDVDVEADLVCSWSMFERNPSCSFDVPIELMVSMPSIRAIETGLPLDDPVDEQPSPRT